jgi:hypothetical protein
MRGPTPPSLKKVRDPVARDRDANRPTVGTAETDLLDRKPTAFCSSATHRR